MKNFVPWLVTVAMCAIVGMVLHSYVTWLPVRAFDVFLMVGVGVSAVVIARGYFKIYAIFDRMEQRCNEAKGKGQ